MDNILITTTVSLNVGTGEPRMVIHLVRGDYGTRRLRLIPVDNSRLMDMENVAAAKVRLGTGEGAPLLIDCVLGDHYADLVPTQAMTLAADEWDAQLVLLDENNQTLCTAPFTIVVHGTVYEGDAVEHTDNNVTAAYYNAAGRLVIEKRDGEKVTVTDLDNLMDAVTDALEEHLVSQTDREALDSWGERVDQDVRTDASPTFAGLTVGSLTISATGEISGATFS
jgi:YD repeat-containing protein